MKLVLTPALRLPPAALLAVATALALALAAAPAWAPPAVAWALHDGFAGLCHQIPERSFASGGVAWAVCHRCTGVLAGLVLGLAASGVAWLRPLAGAPLALLVVALAPAAADWAWEAVLSGANTPASRLATGAWAGLGLGLLAGSAFGGRGRIPAAP